MREWLAPRARRARAGSERGFRGLCEVQAAALRDGGEEVSVSLEKRLCLDRVLSRFQALGEEDAREWAM